MRGPLVAPDLADGPVRLRELRDSDVPAFARALRDPGVFDLAYSGQLAAEEDAVLAHVRLAREQQGAGERILLAFADEDDAMAGLGMLFRVDPRNLDGEIGFWLAPEARGRGIGTRGVRLLTAWALHVIGVERVYAVTNPENSGAQGVLERAGFTLDGTLRGRDRTASGERRDSLAYTMLYTDDTAPPDPRNP